MNALKEEKQKTRSQEAFATLTAPIMLELERGMELKKCRKCGCMKDALDGAALAFGNSGEKEVQALLPTIEAFTARMEPIAYDCIGCQKCFGADATKELSVRFEEVQADSCGGSCGSPAQAPERLKLDPAGFFIVLPQSETGLILCEHYENNGRIAHVIEGRQASLIASTVVEQGLITRLDHAIYLGRELAKAELSLKTGALYEQDAALGTLPPVELAEVKNPTCANTESCACS